MAYGNIIDDVVNAAESKVTSTVNNVLRTSPTASAVPVSQPPAATSAIPITGILLGGATIGFVLLLLKSRK